MLNNIPELKTEFINEIGLSLQSLRTFLGNVARVSPVGGPDLIGREVAKQIAFMALGVDPIQVDSVTDDTVNQFVNSTKRLTDFSKYRNTPFYALIERQLPAVKASFAMYYILRMEGLRNPQSVYYYDGEKKKTGLGSLLKRIFGKKENGEQTQAGAFLSAETEKRVTGAVDNFLDWIGNETGIGKSQGNASNSGPKVYFVWKYFPTQPFNSYPEPILEQTSKNWFEKTWKPLIEGESGLPFETVQRGFLAYFPKIKAGYFKTQADFYNQLKNDIATKQKNDLAKSKSLYPENPLKSLLTKILK